MRYDMVKVVNEPAKHGSSNPSLKTGFSIRNYDGSEFEHSPKRISTSQSRSKSGFSKESGMTLRPLQRFLRSNIGQQWSKVYSDICRRIDKRTFEGNNLLTYVKWQVITDCVMGIDRKVYMKLTFGSYVLVSGFYVHPETGLLQWMKPFSYKAPKPKAERIEFVSSVEVVFLGKRTSLPEWVVVRKVKLSSPSRFYLKRYAKTVIEKGENGWRLDYHEFYDPDEIVSRVATPEGVVVKRRKDYPNLPLSFVVKTKTTLNKKELKEINHLLLLSSERRQPAE